MYPYTLIYPLYNTTPSRACAGAGLPKGTGGYRGVYKHPPYLYANLTPTLICSLAMCIIGGNEKYVQIRKMHCMRSPVSLFRYQRAHSQPRYGRFRRAFGLQLFQLRVGSSPLKPGSVGAWRRRHARLNKPVKSPSNSGGLGLTPFACRQAGAL